MIVSLLFRRLTPVLALLCLLLQAQAQTLDVSWPKDGSVFQQDAAGKGTIVALGYFNSVRWLSGFYALSAKLETLDIKTGNPTGGVREVPVDRSSGRTLISAIIPDVDKGWYRLTVQAKSVFSANVVYTKSVKVGIGEVFIIAGQSNAQGLPNFNGVTDKVASPYNSSSYTFDGVRINTTFNRDYEQALKSLGSTSFINFYTFLSNYGKVAPLTAVRDAASNPNAGIAPTGTSLWYWARLGERIANDKQVPVAFFNAAIGGTTITEWDRSRDPSKRVEGQRKSGDPENKWPKDKGLPYSLLKGTIQLYGSLYGVKSVLWMQGESDTQALKTNDGSYDIITVRNWDETEETYNRRITSATDYKNKLQRVINESRNAILGLNLPWVVAQASLFDNTKNTMVTDGQDLTINSTPGVYRGPFMDAIDGVDERRTPNEPIEDRFGSEPTHLKNGGLSRAADAWYDKLVGRDNILMLAQPITLGQTGTEGKSIVVSNGGNTLTAPVGGSVRWLSEQGDIADPNAPVSTDQSINYSVASTAQPATVSGGSIVRALIQKGDGTFVITQALPFPYHDVDDTGGTPTTQSCTDFSAQCSGNSSEIRTITVNVATEGDYPLTISYQSHEGNKTGIVRAGGSSQTVQFNQTPNGVYTTVTTSGTFHLTAGANTIGLSSGTAGGYLCFNRICVGSGGGPNPTNCDFNISANSVNATCNQQVTLTANCAGANCDGISYTWSGNGINQNGQSVTFTGPGTNGQFTYTVTASRSGCSNNKTAPGTVNVSGCGGGGDGSLTSGSCYVIRSQKTGSYALCVADKMI